MGAQWLGINEDISDKILDDTSKILREIQNRFTYEEKLDIFCYSTMSEMIVGLGLKEILNRYNKWQDDQRHIFHVGEEVKGKESGRLSWVTCVEDTTVVTMLNNGHFFTYNKNRITKTGKFNKTLADIMNGGLERNSVVKYIEEDLR